MSNYFFSRYIPNRQEPMTMARLFQEEMRWRITGCEDCIFILDCIDKRHGPDVGHSCYTSAKWIDGGTNGRYERS